MAETKGVWKLPAGSKGHLQKLRDSGSQGSTPCNYVEERFRNW